jgi:hypothetical protein
MSLFRRVPAEVAALVGPGERALAWAQTSSGWVVATQRCLVLEEAQQLPWESVQRASWDEGVLVLRRGGQGEIRLTLDLAETRLPEVVRERVEASIVLSERVTFSRGGAVIMARRPPSGGEITWTVVFENLDAADPEIQAEATAEVERLKALLA